MKFEVPGIYINTKTKEFAVFQNKRTSPYVIDMHRERIDMINNGFEYMCPISGDASIGISDGWKQVSRRGWTKSEDTKADALAYAEAVVAILKKQEGNNERL